MQRAGPEHGERPCVAQMLEEDHLSTFPQRRRDIRETGTSKRA
jgi:hypothetical protein